MAVKLIPVSSGSAPAVRLVPIGTGSIPVEDAKRTSVVPKGEEPRAPVASEIEQVSFGDGFGRASTNRFLNNFLNIPELASSLDQTARRIASSILRYGNLDEAASALGNAEPSSFLQPPINIEADDLRQAAFGGKQHERSEEFAKAAPAGTMLGNIAGDVATLVLGRSPLAGQLARARSAIGPKSVIDTAPGVKQLLQRAYNSPTWKRFSRGLGRAGETGVEGATISVLNGGDPLETAAYAAGGQAAGSMALTFLPRTMKGWGVFGGTIAGMTALVRLMQDVLPGGSSGNWFEAADKVIDHMKYGLIAGAGAAIAGAGRIRKGALADNFPAITEAITQLPRGAIVSLWSDVTKEKAIGVNRIEPVLDALVTNPALFTPNERRQMKNALKSGEKSFAATLDTMARRPAFKEKLQSITGE